MNKLRIYVDLAAPAVALELLREGTRGHELVLSKSPAASVLAQAERDPRFAMAEVAFGQPDPRAIAEAGELKWIHISSSGITRYDNPRFRGLVAGRNIPVSNSASVYSDPCAVHVLSFMLAQARSLPCSLHDRSASGTGEWQALRGSCGTLRGETVLILGYGAIGRRLAGLLGPFDCKIIAYRRRPRGDEGVPVITGNQLDNALAHDADHVVNILPDSEETRHFFDAARFSIVKPGSVFYNIGRGATVDQDALLDALSSGRIRAAWLDVTDPEPLPDHHALLSHPRCFITPHIAGGHENEDLSLVRHFLNNLDRFVRGEPLEDRVM